MKSILSHRGYSITKKGVPGNDPGTAFRAGFPAIPDGDNPGRFLLAGNGQDITALLGHSSNIKKRFPIWKPFLF